MCSRVAPFSAQTAQLNGDLHTKVLMSNVYELFDKPTHNRTGLQLLHDEVRLFRENTTKAVTNIEMVLHLMRSADQDDSLKLLLEVSVGSNERSAHMFAISHEALEQSH